jgi:drug/metabolite transporter (DMT)-like permease
MGYIYYIFFTIFSALGSLFAKFIYTSRHPDVSGFQLLLLRSIWSTIFLSLLANKNLKNIAYDSIPRSAMPTLAFRCCQGAFTNTVNYVAAKYLPLGIVGVINNMAPAVTVTLAFFFLREKLFCVDLTFLAAALTGCIAIVVGGSSSGGSYATIGDMPILYGALFMSPIMSGAGTIALRKMRKLNGQTVSFYTNLTSGIFNLILILSLGPEK